MVVLDIFLVDIEDVSCSVLKDIMVKDDGEIVTAGLSVEAEWKKHDDVFAASGIIRIEQGLFVSLLALMLFVKFTKFPLLTK